MSSSTNVNWKKLQSTSTTSCKSQITYVLIHLLQVGLRHCIHWKDIKMEEGRRDEDVPSTFFCGSTLMDKYSYLLLLLSTRPKIQIFRTLASPSHHLCGRPYFVRRPNPNSESSISTLPWSGSTVRRESLERSIPQKGRDRNCPSLQPYRPTGVANSR